MKNQEKLDNLFSGIMERVDNLKEQIRINLEEGVTLGSLSTAYDVASTELEFMYEAFSLDNDDEDDVTTEDFIKSQKEIQQAVLEDVSYRTDIKMYKATAIINLIRDIEDTLSL